MYKVIKFFTDLQDNNFPYKAGDIFPRPALKVSKERLAELSSSENKQGEPLIMLIEAPKAEAPKAAAPQKTTAKKTTKKTADK